MDTRGEKLRIGLRIAVISWNVLFAVYLIAEIVIGRRPGVQPSVTHIVTGIIIWVGLIGSVGLLAGWLVLRKL